MNCRNIVVGPVDGANSWMQRVEKAQPQVPMETLRRSKCPTTRTFTRLQAVSRESVARAQAVQDTPGYGP
jgi:hypothetical protein